MNKKVIIGIVAAVVVVAIVVVLVLVLREGKQGFNLAYDMETEEGGERLLAHIFYPKKDKDEYDENYPSTLTLVNEKNNYELTLNLEEGVGGVYKDNQLIAKTGKDSYGDDYDIHDDMTNYTEVKFGKFDGYYYEYNSGIEGCILLKADDEINSYRYLRFEMDLIEDYDEDKQEYKDPMPVFKSSRVQDILNSVEYTSMPLSQVE